MRYLFVLLAMSAALVAPAAEAQTQNPFAPKKADKPAPAAPALELPPIPAVMPAAMPVPTAAATEMGKRLATVNGVEVYRNDHSQYQFIVLPTAAPAETE